MPTTRMRLLQLVRMEGISINKPYHCQQKHTHLLYLPQSARTHVVYNESSVLSQIHDPTSVDGGTLTVSKLQKLVILNYAQKALSG